LNADELRDAVEDALTSLSPVYAGGASESDLYEAALFASCVRAAESANGNVLLTRDGSSKEVALHFRRAPGNLWMGDFTYAHVAFPGTQRVLEIHLGVYVAGASGVAHECDVAILDATEAMRSRTGNVHPRRSGLVASIEAKFYVASPGIGVGRGFLGLASELGGDKCSLGFPAKSKGGIATLLARKRSECFDELLPATAAASRLEAHLEQDIRNWVA
jgi:hypothetical protein